MRGQQLVMVRVLPAQVGVGMQSGMGMEMVMGMVIGQGMVRETGMVGQRSGQGEVESLPLQGEEERSS
jgi:hypothetical protein